MLQLILYSVVIPASLVGIPFRVVRSTSHLNNYTN